MNLSPRLAPFFSIRSFRIYSGLYALLILAISSLPASELPSAPILNDKVIHFCEYFVFGALVFFGFLSNPLSFFISSDVKQRSPSSDPSSKKSVVRFFIALLFAVSFSLFDEFVQSFTPGRDPDFFDALADVAGFGAALFAGRFWTSRRWRVFRPEG